MGRKSAFCATYSAADSIPIPELFSYGACKKSKSRRKRCVEEFADLKLDVARSRKFLMAAIVGTVIGTAGIVFPMMSLMPGPLLNTAAREAHQTGK